MEAGGKAEEEEPSVALGIDRGGGVGELSAGGEVPCGRGVSGLGFAGGERKTLAVVAGTLWKELVVGEGAGGLVAPARRLPFSFGRTEGRGLPSFMAETGVGFFFSGSLDCFFMGEVGPRTGVLGVVLMGGGGALAAPAAPCEMSL